MLLIKMLLTQSLWSVGLFVYLLTIPECINRLPRTAELGGLRGGVNYAVYQGDLARTGVCISDHW